MKFSSHFMKQRPIAWLVALAGCTAVLRADVLDDAKLNLKEVLELPGAFGVSGTDFAGVPLSAEHEEQLLALVAEPRDQLGPVLSNLPGLLESRGHFQAALDLLSGEAALTRVRLLLRLGREAEAKAVLSDEVVAKLVNPPGGRVGSELLFHCQPLEDAEQWELLDRYLAILRERLGSPGWQKAIWLEELDLAWHRGQLPQFMEAAAKGDKLRLCIYQDKLGQVADSERLAGELIAAADPARMSRAELLALLPDSPTTSKAALALWAKPDLSPTDRALMWDRLSKGWGRADFEQRLPQWLRAGGDPGPIADAVAKYLLRFDGNIYYLDLFESMHRRLPDDPRFTFLLGRVLAYSDQARAAELFASIARLPLQRVEKPERYRFETNKLQSVGEEDLKDPALLGFLGLGCLNRQDLAQQIIAGHAEWQTLPVWERARHLAAAHMDHEFVALILGADHTLAENELLPALLTTVLRERSYERVIPPQIFQQVAEKMPALVVGSGKGTRVRGNASSLTHILGESPLGLPALEAALKASLEAAKAMPAPLPAEVDGGIRDSAANQARLKGLFPKLQNAKPVNRHQDVVRLGTSLRLFRPAEIQRLSVSHVGYPMGMDQMRRGRITGGKQYAPLGTLKRWMPLGPDRMMPFREENDLIFALMKSFPAGDPRRIVPDILVAGEHLRGADGALKAESVTAAEDLVAGKLPLQGTELFRYVTLAMRGAKNAELRPILEAVKAQPPAMAKEFMGTLREMQEVRAGLELAREILGTSPAEYRQQQQRPVQDPEVIRFAELVDGQLNAAPETLRLARVVLDKALDLELAAEPKNQPGPASEGAGLQVPQAVRALEMSAQLDAWREAALAKQAQAGMPELRTLKILRSFERYCQRSDEGFRGTVARKILELDPGDDDAARLLIGNALVEGDNALLDRCIRALGLNAFTAHQAPAIFARYGEGREEELRKLVESQAIGRGQDDQDGAARVHAFLLSKQAALAAQFRSWLLRRMKDKTPRQALATQLLDAGDREAAAALFLDKFVTLPDYEGAPSAFPPKPGSSGVRNSYDSTEKAEKEIPYLIENDLAVALVQQIDARGGAPSAEALILRLVLAPSAATFDRYGVPYLASVDDMQRRSALARMRDFFEEFEGAAAVNLAVLEQMLSQDSNSVSLANAARIAGKQLGGGPVLAKIWTRVEAGLKAEDDNQRQRSTNEARGMFPAMLVRADDATWSKYWEWRSSDGEGLPSLYEWPFPSAVPGNLSAERLRQVLPRMMAGPKPNNSHSMPQVGWLGAALETGDAELMAQAKAHLPKDFANYGSLCDLMNGDPAAASPVIGTYEEADGGLIVWWNLVGVRRPSREQVAMDVPLARFSKLDGKFDLRILGGPGKNQLKDLAAVPAAPAAGHLRLDPGVKPEHLGLLVTEAGGGAVRWSPTVQRSARQGKRVEISEESLAAKGFAKMGRPGPGGLPAWELKSGDGAAVTLAEIPWSGSGPISCRAWVTGIGKFTLRCLDATGKQIDQMLMWADTPAIPSWQLAQLGDAGFDSTPPPGTVRIALTAYSPHPDGLTEFCFSGLEFYAAGEGLWPDGFQKVGRVDGKPQALAVAPDGKSIAIGLEGGSLAIVGFPGGEVRKARLFPAPTGRDSSRGPEISRLIWQDEQSLIALNSVGVLYRGNVKDLKFSAVPVPGFSGGIEAAEVTHDKRWLMWRKGDTTLMALDLKPGGKLHSITIPPAYPVQQGPDGVRLHGENEKRFLLKLAELPDGKPVELAGDAPAWEDERGLGGWLEGLVAGADQSGWAGEGDNKRLRIPASKAYDKAEDGSLYYADPQGMVVKVSPPAPEK